jgi:N-acylneuraminate cytidylyltransferase
MTQSPAWTAIIPLRQGSKALPRKNVLPLAGKPLYRYAVDAALAAGASQVIISTNIAEVLTANLPSKVIAIARPEALCTDTSDMATVLLHLIQTEALQGTLVLLQATSPLRTSAHIQAGLAMFDSAQTSLVMAVTAAERSVLKWGFLQDGRFMPVSNPDYCFSNRQQLPAMVRPNGALYVFNAAQFLQHGGFDSRHIAALEMSEADSLDIDNASDFAACEAVLLQSIAHTK